MQSVIIQMVIMLHAAFGCMFLFLNRQHPARFSRLMAQSWLLEAFRACINLTQLHDLGGWLNHWHSLSDCLGIFATWWLLAGCADLMGVRLPVRLVRYYIGISIPLILTLRYLVPAVLPGWLGLPPDRVGFLSVLTELFVIFVPVTVARMTILFWLISTWRRTRLPGALLAIVFGVPYIVFAIAVPFQYYFGYYPEWIYFAWAARVLGFSLGLVMLLFDMQMAAQREKEQALRLSEGRFRRIMESGLIGMMFWNTAGEISAANDAFLRIVGYTQDDVRRGRIRWRDMTPPEFRELDQNGLREVAESGACKPYEKEYYHQNGSRVPILIGGASFPEQSGEGVAFVLDLSERKRTEELVRHLANFPELNPNPVLEFTAEGRLAYHNPAAMGMARKVGMAGPEQILPAETRSIVVECLATGQPRLHLGTFQGKFALSWSFYPIASEQVVHCYIGDISERLQLEEQLRQSQKMEAVGQLSGGIAHDFNNMLTAIIGHLGLLQGNPQVTPEIAESLKEIGTAASRATKLTSQLLAFSRRQVMRTSDLDLNAVVDNLTKMLHRLLGEEVVIKHDYASEQLVFHGDAGLMEQVLVNLAVNARDAMPGGGTLRISTGGEHRASPAVEEPPGTTKPRAFVRLSVSDTGTGISPEIRAKIFEPFFTTKDVGKGTGLGLATAFGIVQQHQGWIEVESEVGRGTTFHIYLPRLETAPLAAATETPAMPARGRGELVLLVEDEPSVQEMGLRALSRYGYRVLTAANGPAAREVWAGHHAEIDLLLTDMIMPEGISGTQLARQFQTDKPSLKVVYTSGYNAQIAGKELKLTDGINFLAKPYEIERLFRTVRTALDGRQSQPPF